LCFSVLGVRAVFVLLTAYAILDELADLIAHVQELVMSLDEFYCLRDAWVSVKRVIVIMAYDFFF
jgi:hypothetical protein